ncbi:MULTISPECIES: DUF2835 domain-containing protein [Pseudomonas]|jgi:hypothetical protein|uniref:Topoisomerase II n=2 Tax=Pseudomonas abyssi TaxID=170540 RepID=A0A2A3MGJ1_9PSED|nr:MULTISPECIES: DUF2835 domain-containing protein [Pseudomonadaceae]MAD01021.1 DUF2835 domain-containing protein [Pseudomonadales bacterium]MAG67440.1 DUF2835 domain-containing protein [Pseudomonadales bacterium]PBK03913.1 topoisomerase II [Pseudomonas abyssi]RGP56921.1 topoisomerase II [Halopseudomonas gallaeciensis]|tara:strand:+ start:43104 stop:43328 length:225 start_codon:yes stop_codon:yes gene_type:complete
MQQLILDLALPAERYLAWYQGRAERVSMLSRDGRRVSLPAHHLRPFLTHQGVYGSFVLQFTDDGKLIKLERLAD